MDLTSCANLRGWMLMPQTLVKYLQVVLGL